MHCNGDNITTVVKYIMIIEISVGSAMKSKCQVWYKPTGNGWIFPEAPFLPKCHH